MKVVILTLLVVFVLGPLRADAQTPVKCDLKVADAPAIRGVKLGMSSKEVLETLKADLKVNRNDYGYLSSRLKTSPYFREKYEANDPILLTMLNDLPHIKTYAEQTPVLLIDLKFTQIASTREFEQMQQRPESLKGVVNFQIDLDDDRVIAIYFLFSSEILDGLDDSDRVAALSQLLNLPEKSWTTGTTHHTFCCGNEFQLSSYRAKGTPASKVSLLLQDLQANIRISTDIEEFLKKKYEERVKKTDPSSKNDIKPD